ncbi:molybdate ABC transporter permease subunit [Rubrobacter tropicus]|uniref:Molybdenum transport system permease n=1 Tax=Rubrobacter tropicus TaxID=2653851 RepID=A0A6G8QE95_9ACTN|nr:ABC transporter permease [Rubrobacter tropicus]QIN84824.1 molybdate ABC transporter permease subunit [Rubrobacter tropicus]
MRKGGKDGRVLRRSAGGDAFASGLAVAALGLLAGFISLPFISLLLWTVSENSWRAMASPVALDALFLSIKTTSISMAIIVTVGTPAAYVLARAEFPGKRILDTLVDVPAVLPPSAAGIALLLTFGRFGVVGQYLNVFGVTISFTTVAVIIAEVFVAGHFYVRQAAVGFAGVRRDVEEAALVDGAGRFSAFTKVTVPLTFPALIAGAMMAWARALGEFGATIVFAGSFRGVTQTVPLAIFAEFQSNIDAAVALSVLVLGFAFVVILAVRYLTRKVSGFRY